MAAFCSLADPEAVQQAISSLDASRPMAIDCEACDRTNKLSLLELCDSNGQIVIIDWCASSSTSAASIAAISDLLSHNGIELVGFALARLERYLTPQLALPPTIVWWDVLAMGYRLMVNGSTSTTVLSLGDLLEQYSVQVPPCVDADVRPVRNWLGRPLSKHQRAFAERQVQFTLALFAQLMEEAQSRDLAEECRIIVLPNSDEIIQDCLRDPTCGAAIPYPSVRQAHKQRIAKAKRDALVKRFNLQSDQCVHFHALGHCTNHPCKFQH